MNSGPSVLLCEDEVIIALDLKFQLKKLGYSISGICKNARELIDQAFLTMPDIIVTDIKLEGELSGIDAIKEIRKKLKIPFIYLSGQQNTSTYEEALKTEPCDFIGKPFSTYQLKSAMDRCCGRHMREWILTNP